MNIFLPVSTAQRELITPRCMLKRNGNETSDYTGSLSHLVKQVTIEFTCSGSFLIDLKNIFLSIYDGSISKDINFPLQSLCILFLFLVFLNLEFCEMFFLQLLR